MRLDDDLRTWRSCCPATPVAGARNDFGAWAPSVPGPSMVCSLQAPQIDRFVSGREGVTGFGPTGDDVDDRCDRGGSESVACGRQRRERQPALCADVQCLRRL
jgi:hypothetical protein